MGGESKKCSYALMPLSVASVNSFFIFSIVLFIAWYLAVEEDGQLVFSPPVLPVGRMLGRVVRQVAALAKSCQIGEAVVGLVSVDVRDGEHDLGSGDRMRHAIMGVAPLAAVICAAEADQAGDEAPLGVVLLVVNGHLPLQ